MVKKILLHGFFLVLPFMLYALWFWYQKRRARNSIGNHIHSPRWGDAPLGWLSAAGLVLLVVSMIVMTQIGRYDPGGTYTSPRLGDDGEIIPAETK